MADSLGRVNDLATLGTVSPEGAGSILCFVLDKQMELTDLTVTVWALAEDSARVTHDQLTGTVGRTNRLHDSKSLSAM